MIAALDRPPGLSARIDVPLLLVADRTGCGFYRCQLPARAIGAQVRDRLDVVRDPLDPDRIVGCTGLSTRGNLFQRPASTDLVDAIHTLQGLGMRAVLEVDDDVWSLDRRHNHAARHWTREACALLALAIKRAAAVTVSTEPLAETVRRWNRNVHVIPNAIDPADFAPRTAADGLLRVGFFGTATHHADLKPVLPVLLDVARRPGVRLLFCGFDPFAPYADPYRSELRHLPTGQPYEYSGWATDMAQHYRNIARLDIAVAPLLDTAFNRAKSGVKFLEAAAHGTPMVCAAVRPYQDTVRHGETGFLARTPADFAKYLNVLIRDGALRRRIGQAAREDVHARHTIAHRAVQWRAVLEVAA